MCYAQSAQFTKSASVLPVREMGLVSAHLGLHRKAVLACRDSVIIMVRPSPVAQLPDPLGSK